MLNLKDVTGVESSPISKSILENSVGRNNLKDSRAYSNYEFLLSSVKSGAFKAPSIIFASGDGTFFPKNTAFQVDFYSANVLSRDGYNNSWITRYGTDESFGLSYYDGSTLFKSFNIDPASGKAKIRSVELRNGNLPKESGLVQLLLGYNESASTNETGNYRHNFRTRHSPTDNSENAIDVFLWDKNNDSIGAVGSRRVLSLYGTGSLEIVCGTEIFGPVLISIETPSDKTAEQNLLAQDGKGVIYYNESKNRFRYSENGGPFKYFGSGAGSSVVSTTLGACAPFNGLGGSISAPNAIGAYFFSEEELQISGVSTVMANIGSNDSDIQFAIYQTTYISINSGTGFPMIGSSGNVTMTKVAQGTIPPSRSTNTYCVGLLDSAVAVKGWFCIVFSNTPLKSMQDIQASMNMSEMTSMADPTYHVPLQFIRNDIVNPNTGEETMWKDTINTLYESNSAILNKNIVPFIRLEIA
jgi:hypothetical protein